MANQSNHFGAGVLAAAIACGLAAPATAAPSRDNAPTDRFIVSFKPGSAERGNAPARKRLIEAAGKGQGLHLYFDVGKGFQADLRLARADPHHQREEISVLPRGQGAGNLHRLQRFSRAAGMPAHDGLHQRNKISQRSNPDKSCFRSVFQLVASSAVESIGMGEHQARPHFVCNL